jgi:hypothetical protein
VRHATPPALQRLASLLDELRTFDGLTERKQGTFYRGSRAFLHFHEHGDELFADVKSSADWDRYNVTSGPDQQALVTVVQRALAPN